MRVGISVFPSLASRKEPYYSPRLGLGYMYLELRGAKCDRECRIVGNDAVCVFILSTSPQSQNRSEASSVRTQKPTQQRWYENTFLSTSTWTCPLLFTSRRAKAMSRHMRCKSNERPLRLAQLDTCTSSRQPALDCARRSPSLVRAVVERLARRESSTPQTLHLLARTLPRRHRHGH